MCILRIQVDPLFIFIALVIRARETYTSTHGKPAETLAIDVIRKNKWSENWAANFIRNYNIYVYNAYASETRLRLKIRYRFRRVQIPETRSNFIKIL